MHVYLAPFIAADMARTNTESPHPFTRDTEDQNIVKTYDVILFVTVHDYVYVRYLLEVF